jgi:prepilin-type N-terminal cleavage/methylation domain-containing protein
MNFPQLKTNNSFRIHSGFTLFEILVVLVLVGIIAIFMISFLISGVSGFIFTKQNVALTQKASLVLARITAEFNSEMKEIVSQTASSVNYIYQYPDNRRYLALVGTGARKEIKILVGTTAPNESDVEVLIDQVSNFTLSFEKSDGLSWVVSDGMSDLYKIIITLTLFVSPTENETVTFTTTVNPPNDHAIIGKAGSVFLPDMDGNICCKYFLS